MSFFNLSYLTLVRSINNVITQNVMIEYQTLYLIKSVSINDFGA